MGDFDVKWCLCLLYTIFDSSRRHFAELNRQFPKCGAAGGAARPFKQASTNAAFHPLFVRDRLTDDAFPFKMMSETVMCYLIILCNVGRQKLGLNNNVTE